MKNILFVLLFTSPIVAMQSDKPQPQRKLIFPSAAESGIMCAYLVRAPLIRDVVFTTAITVAPMVPVLVPVAVVAGLAMRIAMTEDNPKK